MNTDYVSLEQAKLLKEFGFDWKCFSFYTKHKTISIEHITDWCRSVIIEENYNDNFISNKYNVLCSAPTLYQVQRWLREVKDIIIGIDFDNWYEKYICHIYKKVISNSKHIKNSYSSMLVTNGSNEDFDTYEEALSKGIIKALELLKENG